MGQGYSVIHPSAGSAGLESPEVADLEFERTLIGARFLKTIRARSKDGVVVVKVYTKPFASLKLDDRVAELINERRQLAEVPNVLPCHRIVENATSAYLVRQYVHSSLYDRISTNPPLEDIEKKWIAFQLLCAVRDCHARNIYHGDIKTENMLVTSWNWLYLTDFAASVKPWFLPEDNPVDYSLFYDTTPRRICYIAPERFTLTGHDGDTTEQHGLQWSMDIFSVGCVIAELFTEKPTFTLSQLFRYRKGDYDPAHTSLTAIKDDHIREMVVHMISLDPNDRYSAQEYLDFWKEKAFPLYFYNFLHQYTHLITDPTSGQTPIAAGKLNNGGSDDRIDRIYNDYDKISYALGFENGPTDLTSPPNTKSMSLQLFPMQVDIPGNQHTAADRAGPDPDNGALLFSNIVIASLRSTARATSRLKGCELLLTFGEHLTDEAKLDRVLPYAMALLEDPVSAVRIAALRAITQLLSLVTVLSPMNAFIFPRYILPRLSKFVSSPAFAEDSSVRATYAACLSDLATTASRFLDMTQALRADGSLPSIDPEAEDDVAAYAAYQISYDVTREELVQQFEVQTKLFLTDADPAVRRSFLGSVAGLCVFFGDSLASDLILTHLNTYLGDEDWTLRCALCETIVGVAAFIGGASLEDFILPLLIQALTDPEEMVTEQVIRSIASMAKLGLFQRWIVLELIMIIARFALHPNHWIREATAQFIACAASRLSYADFRSLIEPLMRPVLKIDVADAEEATLLDSFKKPLPRSVMDLAKVWATRTEKGVFWKPAQKAKSFSFDASSNKSLMDMYRGVTTLSPARSHKNDEDDQWMTRLRNAGMRSEDEAKLLALRDYIWRIVVRTEKEAPDSSSSPFNQVVSLTSLKVPLQNVLFEDDLKYYDQIAGKQEDGRLGRTTTLAEALKEATAVPSHVDDSPTPAVSKSQIRKQEAESSQVMSRTNSDISQSTNPTHPASSALRIDGKLSATRAVSGTEAGLSSSPASQRSVGSRTHSHTRHRESAMSLMKRTETTKAGAEIGTDSANALGRVDVHASGRVTPTIGTPVLGTSPGVKSAHAYDGGDPNVQKYLDTMYTSNFPLDLAEFGPRVQSLTRAQIANATGADSSGRWRPQGLLVAAIGEHTDQITGIAVAPDHAFFITGSADGTVRVWDTVRLERNITHKARQVHRHRSGAAVTAVCFVEGTHSFISCASDGSLNVVKVDVSESAGTTRYGKLQVLRDWSLVPGIPEPTDKHDNDQEHVRAMDHFRFEGQSLCLLLTSHSRFVALDLKHMDVLYTFTNPVSHGTPTCFTVHKKRQWLLIGTDHGVLDLWDLRFRLRLKSWTFRNPCAITRISTHPGKRSSHRMRVCVAGGTGPGHVSIWDVEKLACCEVYSTTADGQQPKLSHRDLELIQLDEEKEDSQLDKFVSNPGLFTIGSPKPVASPMKDGSATPSTQRNMPSHKQSVSNSIMDFVLQMHIPADNQTSANDARQHFVLTAGPEWKTRFWDPDKLANCAVVNSGAIEPFSTGSLDETMQVAASLVGADTRVYTDSAAAAQDAPSRGTASPTSSSKSKVSRSVSSNTVAGTAKQTRYDMIRNSAHHLLSGHRDEITCLALVEKPFGMVVTGDRSGAVYVFQ
ncbi:protein kinase WD40 [Myriangium duriaei CBS 260.36]|uniref:non-specific serine/threonine protein kinase n=1 Tax=Myriangium duriaei CBS 260.36 TaxID=1168546 RepID=A0A9P4IS31_9PEZI|nr:protein kinase WD40 [Myriangium duriaei CBS 260.36]